MRPHGANYTGECAVSAVNVARVHFLSLIAQDNISVLCDFHFTDQQITEGAAMIVQDIGKELPALSTGRLLAMMLNFAELQPGLNSRLLQASQLILGRAVAQRPILDAQSLALAVVCTILGAHEVLGVCPEQFVSKFKQLDTGIDLSTEEVNICKQNLLNAVNVKTPPAGVKLDK